MLYVGDVGAGFTKQALDALHARLVDLERATWPFTTAPLREDARYARWVEPVLVGEVVYRQFTADHRLRHIAWRGLRHDVLPEYIRWPSPE